MTRFVRPVLVYIIGYSQFIVGNSRKLIHLFIKVVDVGYDMLPRMNEE